MEKLWNANYIKIWSAEFLVNFAIHLIVPLLPLYLSEQFGATKDTIGLILMGYMIMAIAVRPLAGSIIDSLPRRVVLLSCGFLFAAFFVGYIVAGSLTVFAVFRTVHGLPYGANTVATSTVAIDVLPSSRRSEGIGYFGLGKNFAMALGPMLAVYLISAFPDGYRMLFVICLVSSLLGLVLEATIKFPKRDYVPQGRILSLDRFFLLKGWPEAIAVVLLSFSYGILSTYVAIYGKEVLGITTGTGTFFTLFAVGLIISRITGARALRKGQISRNCAMGVATTLAGYILFASVHAPIGYYGTAILIGLGNGHFYPAFQNMFIGLAPNSQRGTASASLLTSWDAGLGLGMLLGGVIAEHAGYGPTFWTAAASTLVGGAWAVTFVRRHFEANRLR